MQHTHPRCGRKSVLAALLAALSLVTVTTATFPVTTSAAAEPAATEHRQLGGEAEILVVQATLQEAMRPLDAADTSDLDTFVARVLDQAPEAPDALLLSDVLGPGAEHVARQMTRRTRTPYRVLMAPGTTAFLPDGGVRASAIIVNARTLRAEGEGSWVRVEGEDQALVQVAGRGRPATLLLAGTVSANALDGAVQLQEAVDARAAEGVAVLGLDMAVPRCSDAGESQALACPPQGFWSHLSARHGYDDAALVADDVPTRPFTDFVFARGQVADARVDTEYDTDVPDLEHCTQLHNEGRGASAGEECSAYYADQPFTWAAVSPGPEVRQTVFPAEVVLDRCEGNRRVAGVGARVVNGSDSELTTTVQVSGGAPVELVGAEHEITVPAGEARDVFTEVRVPHTTEPGDLDISVQIGSESFTTPVRIPVDCHVVPATATSFAKGNPPENAVDGDPTTIWHTDWTTPNPLPQSITLNLGQERTVSSLEYLPRQDGNLNGTILDYRVLTSADGDTFTEVARGTWKEDVTSKSVTFDPTSAFLVRLESTRGTGPHASAAEVVVR